MALHVDAQALVDMGLRSTPEDLRLRFFSPVRPAVGVLTSLLTEFDRAHHIAVAAYDPGKRGDLGILDDLALTSTVLFDPGPVLGQAGNLGGQGAAGIFERM